MKGTASAVLRRVGGQTSDPNQTVANRSAFADRGHNPNTILQRPDSAVMVFAAPMEAPGTFRWRYLAGGDGRVVGVICISAPRPTDRISVEKKTYCGPLKPPIRNQRPIYPPSLRYQRPVSSVFG